MWLQIIWYMATTTEWLIKLDYLKYSSENCFKETVATASSLCGALCAAEVFLWRGLSSSWWVGGNLSVYHFHLPFCPKQPSLCVDVKVTIPALCHWACWELEEIPPYPYRQRHWYLSARWLRWSSSGWGNILHLSLQSTGRLVYKPRTWGLL